MSQSRDEAAVKIDLFRWRRTTVGLSLQAKGLLFDLLVLIHRSRGRGYREDADTIARAIGCRDYRTVAKPLSELLAAGQLVSRSGYLFDPNDDRRDRILQ